MEELSATDLALIELIASISTAILLVLYILSRLKILLVNEKSFLKYSVLILILVVVSINIIQNEIFVALFGAIIVVLFVLPQYFLDPQ